MRRRPDTHAIGVAAGGGYSCALRAGGQIACWGWNLYGNLGDGTNTGSNIPVAVQGISDATAVAAGAVTPVRCGPVVRSLAGVRIGGANWGTARLPTATSQLLSKA
jgi:hypothetical protein